jgi:hypothetical protein
MRYLLMWSGRLTVPRPPRTCHNVTDPGPQEDLGEAMTDHYHYIILRVTSSEHPLDKPDPLDARVKLLTGWTGPQER